MNVQFGNFQFDSFQFESLAEFFAMGGHATYVWGAYGVALVVMVWLVVRPLLRRASILNELRQNLKKRQHSLYEESR